MRSFAVKLASGLRLTRLTMAFGAVSDVWFVTLLTRADERYSGLEVAQMPLGAALVVGAVVALGLFAYGAALNDVLDVRHDAAFSPDRPIPAGRIKLGQAVVVTVGALIIAVLAGAILGMLALVVTLMVAAGILFYNAAGRFVPSVGSITIGLVHAAHMLIPNARLTFTLPVWLVMTHAMAIATAVHMFEDKRPRLATKGIVAIAIGWLFWSLLIVGSGWVRHGLWPDNVPWWALAWPALAVAGFIVVARWKTTAVAAPIAAEKLRRYGAMWQALYGAAWLAALGLNKPAACLGLFAVGGFVSMTVIKELMGLTGRPAVYR
ncbi:MAG: UbiA family prenyltransferase [Planctomycetota bacterium]|jgi:4-hydroxybenzoate polyprenyltransferase